METNFNEIPDDRKLSEQTAKKYAWAVLRIAEERGEEIEDRGSFFAEAKNYALKMMSDGDWTFLNRPERFLEEKGGLLSTIFQE